MQLSSIGVCEYFPAKGCEVARERVLETQLWDTMGSFVAIGLLVFPFVGRVGDEIA